MPGPAYTTVIERGYTPVNDRIMDFLLPRVGPAYLDVGCNTGWLLMEAAGGVGVDASEVLVARAVGRGLAAACARAEALPFRSGAFRTAVLSCVLEQCRRWRQALEEACRVADRVIGINPTPGASPWGAPGAWVRAVIAPEEMQRLGARVEPLDPQRYFFEIE